MTTMKKKIVLATLALIALVAMSACAAGKPNKQQEQNMAAENAKALVVYFSWSGNTKAAGQYIAKKIGADTFEVEREKPYPNKYEECVEEAHAEAGSRPAINGQLKSLSEYDVIFIGAPVWSGTLPMPMFSFLEKYDFTGKMVIPFCTCYTSAGQSLNDINKSTPGSEHKEGIALVTKDLGGKRMENNFAKIDNWLHGLGLVSE